MNIKKLRQEQIQINTSIKSLNAELSIKKKELADINKKINQYADEPYLSQHALLMYIKRIHGIDIDLLEKILLPDGVKAMIRAGATEIRHGNVTLVIKDSTIVTIY